MIGIFKWVVSFRELNHVEPELKKKKNFFLDAVFVTYNTFVFKPLIFSEETEIHIKESLQKGTEMFRRCIPVKDYI